MKQIQSGLKGRAIPNLIMFGAPGVGKGTFGRLLVKDLHYKNISTGDQIRDFLKEENLTGEMKEIQKIFETGGLVDDSMIMSIIGNNLHGNHNGIIFDGFPRNSNQANLFSKCIDIEYSTVLNFTINESILIEKLMGRRLCEDCGEGYNLCSFDRDGYKMDPLLPKVEHTCDVCGGQLIRREDDKEDIIKERFKIYEEETEPILEYFESLGIQIIHFEPKKGKADYPTLLKIVENKFLSTIAQNQERTQETKVYQNQAA